MRAPFRKDTNTLAVKQPVNDWFVHRSLIKLGNYLVRVFLAGIESLDSWGFNLNICITNNEFHDLFRDAAASHEFERITWLETLFEVCTLNTFNTAFTGDFKFSLSRFGQILRSLDCDAPHLLCEPWYYWCAHRDHSNKEADILFAVCHNHLYHWLLRTLSLHKDQ